MRIYEVQSYGDSRYFLEKKNAEVALKEAIEDDEDHYSMLKETGITPVNPGIFELDTED